MGFNQEIPFDIGMTSSQYSNSEAIDSEVQLADSGYGQGQMLVNPLHLAWSSAFFNEGNMIIPYLEYEEGKQPPTGPKEFHTRSSKISFMKI